MLLLLEAGDSLSVAKVSNPAASVRNGGGGGQVGLSADTADGWAASLPTSGPSPEQRRNNSGAYP